MRQVFESYHSIFRVNIRQKTEKKEKSKKKKRQTCFSRQSKLLLEIAILNYYSMWN